MGEQVQPAETGRWQTGSGEHHQQPPGRVNWILQGPPQKVTSHYLAFYYPC